MWGFSVPGYEENNQHFSPCSLRWVAPVLRAKSGLCFRSKNELQALCGNGIVEEKEECDVGFVEKDQEEKCCDENCQFKPNVTCSDFNAPCCKDCMVANSSIVCEQKNELTCSGGAFCDGRNLDCPPPSYLPDNTSCVDLGKCQGGRCLNFCQLRGIKEKKTLKPCLCSQNTTAMCRRCCLEEKGDDKGECFPTSVVQENERTCQIGKCDKGECVKVVQQLSHRIFLFIQRLNTDQLVEFMKSNIVGTVIILSLVVWIPVSCIVSCADKRKRKQRDKFRERLRKANQEAQVKDYRIRNSALRTPTVTKSSQITGNKAQLQQSVRQKLVQKGHREDEERNSKDSNNSVEGRGGDHRRNSEHADDADDEKEKAEYFRDDQCGDDDDDVDDKLHYDENNEEDSPFGEDEEDDHSASDEQS
ncbi:ADAM 17-like protease isoform X3 [Littorina saxatilis]|uniref:ADAM 17-like protease isoform X3 n=1 Tax=Littorina saxatilis TaxID=31220 RepID=UPI0038B486EE